MNCVETPCRTCSGFRKAASCLLVILVWLRGLAHDVARRSLREVA